MTSRLFLVVFALVAAAVLGAAAPASGQPSGPPGELTGQDQLGQPAARSVRPSVPAPRVKPATPGTGTSPEDATRSSGKGMAALFWIFALGCVGGSIFVISRRNLIAAVMGMVATFFAVAALYMMLYANFLAVIQMLVYAGAIMVLFVFVVMVLNKPEDDPWVDRRALAGKVLALVGMGYLVLRLVMVLWAVEPEDKVAAELAPAPIELTIPRGTTPERVVYDWGSTAAVGKELFTAGLFPFEAISILLLIAVVGAIAVARPLKDEMDAVEGRAS